MPNVEIYVALDPHLKKYQLRECGGDKLFINQRSEIGIIVIALLEPVPDHTFRARPDGPDKNEVIISISDRLCNGGRFLHEEGQKIIARKIRKMFLCDLRLYIRQNHLDFGTPEKYALRNFFDKYGITDDDFDESSMYRDYNRWKRSKKIDI